MRFVEKQGIYIVFHRKGSNINSLDSQGLLSLSLKDMTGVLEFSCLNRQCSKITDTHTLFSEVVRGQVLTELQVKRAGAS